MYGELTKNTNFYRVVAEFFINGERWVVVRNSMSACVMTYTEWKSIYGRQHPEKWERKGW